jgi:hypothetical protein
MRKAASSVVTIFLLMAINYSKPAGIVQQNSSQIAQTTDWLKQMFAAHARSVKKYGYGSTLENHLDEVEFDDCTFKYKDLMISHEYGRDTIEQMFAFTIPLAELDTAKFKNEIRDDHPTMILFTTDDKNVIKGTLWWEVDHLWKISTKESAYQSRVVIPFDSLERAGQVTKYLIQAVELCRNNKRP